MRLRTEARNGAVDAYDADVNTGAGTAVLQLRTGSRAAAITDAAAGTLLAEFDLPNPAFGDGAAGVITAASLPLSTTGDNDGTIGHYRVVNRNGDCSWDSESVGTGGAVELTVNTLDIETGGAVEVTAWTVTQPAE